MLGENTQARLITLMQFFAVACLTVFSGSVFVEGFALPSPDNKEIIDTVPQPPSINGGLQVKPSVGEPKPIKGGLQGASRSPQQEAAGDLQKQSPSGQLQPNAKIPDFPSDL